MRRNEVILCYIELDTKKDLVHVVFLQQKEKSFSIYHRDETVIQIGDHHYWLWICIEPIHKSVLGINISQKKETCL